jgi:hypothetical protein
VVRPVGAGPQYASLERDADEFLTKNQSLLTDLRVVVGRRVADVRSEPAAAAADRQAHLETLIEIERAARTEAEQKLADARIALQQGEERHRSEMASTAAQLAKHQAQYEISIARAAANWEMVDEQLRKAATEVERCRQDQAAAAADVDRLSRRESELSSLLAEATATRLDLERRLADGEAAFDAASTRSEQERREADERHRDERENAEKLHASAMADAAARSGELEAALNLAQQELASQVAEVERRVQREAELTAMLAGATETQANLERRLAGTEAAFQEADARATRERLAAAKKAADREAELEGQIRQERATRTTLEQAVADAHAALRDAQERHDAALTMSARERADREARFDRELTETAAARDTLAQRLIDAELARDESRRDQQMASADVDRLTKCEADLMSELGGALAARETAERQLADALSAIGDADDRAVRERAAAADRHADLEARLAEALDGRARLETTLEETRSTARSVERSLNEEINALRMRALEQKADFETQLANAGVEHERRVAEEQDASRRLTLERDAIQGTLGATEDQLRRRDVEHREASERFERDRAAADADIRRLREERAETGRQLEDARKDFQNAFDRLSTDHAAALAALVAAIAERDAQLQEQAAQYSSSQQASEARRRELQETFQRTLSARDDEMTQFQGKLTAAHEARNALEQRLSALQAEVDQHSHVRTQLDESRAESHRLFHLAPLPMFRCTRDGALTEANRAWATLVRRKPDEHRGNDFAAAVFESPNDLSWLIEHCLSTRAKESIETTVRRKDGARLFVRLSACASKGGVIEIAAEDLTRLRVLQDRLGQAHRMEAVGRLASEVALTCGKLLNDVRQNAQQWLMDVGESASRQQGELLLHDLNRAADYLQKLVAYSDKQVRTPTLVELNTLMRDLAPVLKHVAGDDVEIQLPNASAPLNVDVETERVERLLVNLAAYGRERMPFGGSLTIELGTSVVDHRFTAKYPNVRPGPHALITVTENRRPARADGLLQLRDGSSARSPLAKLTHKPAMDLGTLQGLVGQCGGHLWMRLQPLGDIVAKIRLPLVTSYDQSHARAAAAGSGGGRSLTRWFHI